MTDNAPAPAATAARAILYGQIRHGLIVAATLAVSQGIATEAQAGAIVPALTDYLVGLVLAIGATLWSAISAKVAHSNSALAARLRALTGDTGPLSSAPVGQAGSGGVNP